MPAKSKKMGPEDMLLRVIRVAEILARGEDATITIAESGRRVQPLEPVDRLPTTRQKTQVEHFRVS
jgi:hypothetical protein